MVHQEQKLIMDTISPLGKDMIAASKKTSSFNEASRVHLPADFVPGPFDVICSYKRMAHKHEGNIRYEKLVRKLVSQYAETKSRMEKSLIISSVVEAVREASPLGGFVKQEEDDGLWYEVGDHAAREKVSHSFRNVLHTKYRSSIKGKKRRREAVKKRVQPKSSLPRDELATTTQQNGKLDDLWSSISNSLPYLVASEDSMESEAEIFEPLPMNSDKNDSMTSDNENDRFLLSVFFSIDRDEEMMKPVTVASKVLSALGTDSATAATPYFRVDNQPVEPSLIKSIYSAWSNEQLGTENLLPGTPAQVG